MSGQYLTTVDTLREELGKSHTESKDDAFYERVVRSISALVEDYCKRKFRREVETHVRYIDEDDRRSERPRYIFLPRYPVRDVSLVTMQMRDRDGDVAETILSENVDYRVVLDGKQAIELYPQAFLTAFEQDVGVRNEVHVTYEGGYYLPGHPERDLPEDIEDTTIRLCVFRTQTRGRDPMLRQEAVPDLATKSYFSGQAGQQSLKMQLGFLDQWVDHRY